VRDASDDVFVECAKHAGDGKVARWGVGDELGEHGVVVDGDDPAFEDAAVFADAGPAGLQEARDAAWRGHEAIAGVLGIDAALDGMAAQLDIASARWASAAPPGQCESADGRGRGR
jgi:hypothetical protein